MHAKPNAKPFEQAARLQHAPLAGTARGTAAVASGAICRTDRLPYAVMPPGNACNSLGASVVAPRTALVVAAAARSCAWAASLQLPHARTARGDYMRMHASGCYAYNLAHANTCLLVVGHCLGIGLQLIRQEGQAAVRRHVKTVCALRQAARGSGLSGDVKHGGSGTIFPRVCVGVGKP